MGVARRVFSNSFYLFLDLVLVNLLGLLFWFFNGKFLVPQELGIVSTSINLALLLSSLSILGFQGVLPKLIPEYLEKKQHGKIVSLTRFTFKVIAISNFILILTLLIFSSTVQSLLKLPIEALLISSLLTIAVTFSTFFGCIMWGFQNMRVFLTTDLVGVVAKLVVTVLLLLLGFGFAAPLIGVLAGYILIDLRRFRKSWFFPASGERIDGKQIILNYALPYFGSLIAGLAFSNFQIILLASLQGQYVTGSYSMAFLIASVISIVPTVLAQALFPIISQLSVGRKTKRQGYLMRLVLRYAIFLMLPLAVTLIFFSKPILLLIRGEYVEVTDILSILAIAAISFGLGQLFLSSLYAIGRTKLNRDIWILSALIFLSISPILIKLYSAQGLAASFMLTSLILLALGYYFTSKLLKLKIDWQNLLKLGIPLCLLCLFFYFADVIQADLPIKIIFALLGGLIYLFVSVPIRFYKKEDLRVLQIISVRSPILKGWALALVKWFSRYVE